MTDRTQSLALLVVTALCMVVCLCAMLLRPSDRDEHAGTESINYRIDPNQADAATLCLLPGIAKGKARLIVLDRRAHGPFHSIQDLTRVPQIGDKTAAAMAPLLRFDK